MALLVGLAGNTIFGLWWLDPTVGLLIAGVALKEGIETWRGEGCCAPAPTSDECCSPTSRTFLGHWTESMMMLMAACSLLVLLVVGALLFLGVRAVTGGRLSGNSARAILDRRLATGDLSPEEYFELDSVLRSSEPRSR
ncbi:MAG: hypothetical protein M3088_01875 [Actinomycetota bacterium]|nr:hypothetical protein [Actinomycetota bacterium]